VRDPYKVPDFIHTQKRHPKTNLRSPTVCGFLVAVTREPAPGDILMSDRGLPPACATSTLWLAQYSLINAARERVWAKFHFKTQQSHKHWTTPGFRSSRTTGNRRRKICSARSRRATSEWKIRWQIMTNAQAQHVPAHWLTVRLTRSGRTATAPVIDIARWN